MDETWIVVSVIGIAGSLLISQMWQMNWFKRENFKIQKSTLMKTNAIKFKKLERELGINTSKRSSDNSLTPLIKQGLQAITEGSDDSEENWVTSTMRNVYESNPEMWNSLIAEYAPKVIGSVGSKEETIAR